MKNRAEICSFSEQFRVAPSRASSRRADRAPESGSLALHLGAASAANERIESGAAQGRAERAAGPAGAAYRPDRSGQERRGVARKPSAL